VVAFDSTRDLYSSRLLTRAGSAESNPPNDRPLAVQPMQAAELDAAMAPYAAQARRTYPAAKRRFLRGLPSGQIFFVTVDLKDMNGHSERVFVRVAEIRGVTVSGSIASDILMVEGFKPGQRYSYQESEIVDWLIARPDGSEEGNFVGKFLDTYRP